MFKFPRRKRFHQIIPYPVAQRPDFQFAAMAFGQHEDGKVRMHALGFLQRAHAGFVGTVVVEAEKKRVVQ